MGAWPVLSELKRHGVTHVVGLPDNSSAQLFEALAADRDIRLVSVTREAEAFAVAAGLWLGGAVPVVLIQNTGLLESGDGLRGTITRMRVPLVCLITYRGLRSLGANPVEHACTAETLSRADLDSVALVTEPTLEAWGVPFVVAREGEEVAAVADAFSRSAAEERTFAVLTTAQLR
jgi:sulfopyruvate decarboxylase TPP-binding subunit